MGYVGEMSAKYSDTFGPVLRQLRNRRDFTQERLGEMAETTSAFISMLESGHKYPNLEMLFKLAYALGIRPGLFLDEMEKRLGQGSSRT